MRSGTTSRLTPTSANQRLPELLLSAELSNDEKARAIVLQPELRKLAQKLLLQQEWRLSVEQSHPPGAGREAALQQLQHDVQIMQRALHTVVDTAHLASTVSRGAELCRQGGAGMTPTWF